MSERSIRRAQRLALEAVRQQGCVCDAEIHVIGAVGDAPMTVIGHEDWCPLLREREGTGAPEVCVVLEPEPEGPTSGDAA